LIKKMVFIRIYSELGSYNNDWCSSW
jgi:hypothetical protein